MKNFIFIFFVIFLFSCGAEKKIGFIDNSNETKHVLVFVNNASNEYLAENIKTKLIDLSNLKNSKNNIIFHTERNEKITYEFGIEILIEEILVTESSSTPRSQTYQANYLNEIPYYNQENIKTTKLITNRIVDTEIIEHKISKNCIINAQLSFINFKNDQLIHKQNISKSNSYRETYFETKGDNFYNLSQNGILHLKNSNVQNSSKFESSKKPILIFDNNLIKFIPKDNEFVNETILKIKNDYIKFYKNI